MSDEVQERRDAVVHGLLPIVRVADQPLRWTIDERLAHHGCPGVGIAVMHDGHIAGIVRPADTDRYEIGRLMLGAAA